MTIVGTLPVYSLLNAAQRLSAMERLLLAKLLLESALQQEESREAATDAGWPVGFFEATAGAWAGDPLARAPQAAYETRLELQ